MVSTTTRTAASRDAAVHSYAEDVRNANGAVCAVAAYRSGQDGCARAVRVQIETSKPFTQSTVQTKEWEYAWSRAAWALLARNVDKTCVQT